MNSKNVTLAPEVSTPELPMDKRAVFWGIPAFAPTPTELAALKQLSMQLNWDRYHCSSQYFKDDHFLSLIKTVQLAQTEIGSSRISAPYGFLSLHRLHRNNAALMVWKEPMHEKFFHLDKKTEHLGLGFLLGRKGVACKDLIKAGCPPILFFTHSWSSTDLPAPGSVISTLVDASSSSSINACAFILGELMTRCNDPAVLIKSLIQKAHQDFKGVWSSRAGIANSAEATSTRRVHFALGQLVKHKALPGDLITARDICAAKLLSLDFDASNDKGAEKTFTDLEQSRMAPLVLLARTDDLQGFESMLPLCGLRIDSDFSAGVPKGVEVGYSSAKYWTTRLVSMNAWLCAGRALDLGDNPWLCAGDGGRGHASDSNPFTLLAILAPTTNTLNAHLLSLPVRFAEFALSFARASLRDAETREPGRGHALCLEAFEASRKSNPTLWQQTGSLTVIAACESALMSIMIESSDESSASARTKPVATKRSRL